MSIFKDTFTPTIQDQLKVRGNAFLQRTPQSIIYINGRAAWIRMTSGVDIGDDNGQFARDNILQGGTLTDNKFRTGVGSDYKLNAYSNKTVGPNGTVNNLYGLRPMPGITGLDVSSLSAYGSVRQATVTFNCWDVKQLELLELLYMRPGFIALVEWGWLPYLDNNGNLQTNTDFYSDEFLNADSSKSLQERLTDLYLMSQKHSANSEGILGYIKNYEWAARPDGGYDCRTEIISTGEIMESLKVNYSVNYRENPKVDYNLLFDPNTSEISTESYGNSIYNLYERNIIAGLAGELIFYLYSKYGSIDDNTTTLKNKNFRLSLLDNDGKITGDKGYIITLLGFQLSNTISATSSTKSNTNDNQIQSDIQTYIDLESLTKILSKWVVIANKDKAGRKSPLISISTKRKKYDDRSTIDNENLKCLSHPFQISVDPTICLIKNTNYSLLKNIEFENKIPQVIDNAYGNAPAYRALARRILNITVNQGSTADLQNGGLKTLIKEYYENASTTEDYIKLGEILSNAFEEYKVKNIKIFNQSSTSVTGTFVPKTNTKQILYYYLPDPKRPLNSYNFEPLYKTESKDKIAKLNFKTFIEKYKYETYFTQKQLEFLNPSNNIKSLAEQQVKDIIDTPETNKEIQDLAKASEALNIFLEAIPEDKKYFTQTPNGEFGEIGDIFINLNYILDLSLDGSLEASDTKEKREINLYDFLKKMMYGVQGALGSLNNFDIHTDPSDGVARIIDINYVDEVSPQDAYNNAFTFLSNDVNGANPSLNGLFNNLRSYKIRSQIFKDQTSIVAISAQNGGGQLGLDNETLVGFNKGIKNRILPDIGPPSSDFSYNDVKGQTSLVNTLVNSLRSLLQFMKDLGWIDDEYNPKFREYNQANSEKYKGALRDLLFAFKSLTKTSSSFKSIIPTIVSLELDGIGGLIIGNMFRLPNDLLPAGYKSENGIGRKLGYIVTKLGHKVSNNDWTTQIDAQTIILESPEEKAAGVDLTKLLKDAQNGITSTLSPTGKVISQKISKDQKSAYDEAERLEPGFHAKVAQVAKNIGVSEQALAKIMYLESARTYKPSITNSIGCVGLTQFCPDKTGLSYKTIGGTKYQLSALAKMTRIQQLDVVEKYFKSVGFNSSTPRGIGDLYLVNLYPVALNKPNTFVLGSEDKRPNWKFAVQSQNPGFPTTRTIDGKKVLTRGDVINFANNL
jgi:hypothetical protein